jgi:hypothetical protein
MERQLAGEAMRFRGVGTMEILVYTANGMYLASYFMKEMLHLRMLTVAAALCLSAYFYFRPEPMMTVVCWNLFFVALNVFQITRIAMARSRSKNIRASDPAGRDAVAYG